MKLYGFSHSTCIYESAAALVSIHLTKKGAWKAMHKFWWDEWVRVQNPSDTNIHGFGEYQREARKSKIVLENEKSYISEIEVLP